MTELQSIEICAGAGGQAIGLEQAGFEHQALIEIDAHACNTLKTNRPKWNVIHGDLWDAVEGKLEGFKASSFKGVDLLGGGVPCPPFSIAGKQLGHEDERDLFPAAVELADMCRPRAVMLENVRGLLDPVFEVYRRKLERQLAKLGYRSQWQLLNASDFGVPQLRPRVVLVAMQKQYADGFEWPDRSEAGAPPTVGKTLYPLMSSRGWRGAARWRDRANGIAPTLVGGSKKHGGPDLGPTRARAAWAAMGVDGLTLAEEPPHRDFVGMPKLTVPMTALIQGFPPKWTITGKKTPAYRQVGNAFPPPVARAVALQIHAALAASKGVYFKKIA